MKIKYCITVLILIFLKSSSIYAQVGYAKDSLQIKVYTEIEYVNYRPKSVLVKKVFCDYCSEKQIEFLKEEAKFRSFNERFYRNNRLASGKKKLAIYIRIAKKDFSAIKEEDEEGQQY